MRRDAVEDGAHAVLADAEADVAPGAVPGLEVVVAGLQVADVVERRAVEVGAAADEQRHLRGERLQHVLPRLARRDLASRPGTRGWRRGELAASNVCFGASSGPCARTRASIASSAASSGFLAFQASNDFLPAGVAPRRAPSRAPRRSLHLGRDEVGLGGQAEAPCARPRRTWPPPRRAPSASRRPRGCPCR